MDGLILNSVSGLYYVETKEKIYASKPRGIFRKNNIKPVVGDRCRLSVIDENQGVIEEIYERKNHLTRPPISNLDNIFMVVSTDEPKPNYSVLDQLISISESEKITPIILITKVDISDANEVYNIYKNIYKTIIVDYDNENSIKEVKNAMKDKISAFSGNSGVGKSTLLNAIDDRLEIKTNIISKSLGRGKHTTREVTLYKLKNNGYIADTPGFSAIEFSKVVNLEINEIQNTFIDFRKYLGHCQFNDCVHNLEIGCAIKEAVEKKQISISRYESYIYMVEEAKKIKKW